MSSLPIPRPLQPLAAGVAVVSLAAEDDRPAASAGTPAHVIPDGGVADGSNVLLDNGAADDYRVPARLPCEDSLEERAGTLVAGIVWLSTEPAAELPGEIVDSPAVAFGEPCEVLEGPSFGGGKTQSESSASDRASANREIASRERGTR